MIDRAAFYTFCIFIVASAARVSAQSTWIQQIEQARHAPPTQSLSGFLEDDPLCAMLPSEFPDSLVLIAPADSSVYALVHGDSVANLDQPRSAAELRVHVVTARCKHGTDLLTRLVLSDGRNEIAVKVSCGMMMPACVYTGLGARRAGGTHYLGFQAGRLVPVGLGPPPGAAPESGSTIPAHPGDLIATTPAVLYATLRRWGRKDDYESWAEYQIRVSRHTRWFAVDLTCLPYTERLFEYDAESRRMELHLDDASWESFSWSEARGFLISCTTTGRGAYVGENAYGARRRVSVEHAREYAVIPAFGHRISPMVIGWWMSPEVARAEAPYLRARVFILPGAGENRQVAGEGFAGIGATPSAPEERRVQRFNITAAAVRIVVYSTRTRREYASVPLTFN